MGQKLGAGYRFNLPVFPLFPKPYAPPSFSTLLLAGAFFLVVFLAGAVGFFSTGFSSAGDFGSSGGFCSFGASFFFLVAATGFISAVFAAVSAFFAGFFSTST